MFLIRDVISHINSNKVYGTAGTEVKVLNDHQTVQIVENAAGFRFPCRTDNLTEDHSQVQPSETRTVEKDAGPKKHKVAHITQQSLF